MALQRKAAPSPSVWLACSRDLKFRDSPPQRRSFWAPATPPRFQACYRNSLLFPTNNAAPRHHFIAIRAVYQDGILEHPRIIESPLRQRATRRTPGASDGTSSNQRDRRRCLLSASRPIPQARGRASISTHPKQNHAVNIPSEIALQRSVWPNLSRSRGSIRRSSRRRRLRLSSSKAPTRLLAPGRQEHRRSLDLRILSRPLAPARQQQRPLPSPRSRRRLTALPSEAHTARRTRMATRPLR